MLNGLLPARTLQYVKHPVDSGYNSLNESTYDPFSNSFPNDARSVDYTYADTYIYIWMHSYRYAYTYTCIHICKRICV